MILTIKTGLVYILYSRPCSIMFYLLIILISMLYIREKNSSFTHEYKNAPEVWKIKNAPRPSVLKLMRHINHKSLIIFIVPFYGRDQSPPCLGSRGEGFAERVLRLQPPVAGADTRYEDVNASS